MPKALNPAPTKTLLRSGAAPQNKVAVRRKALGSVQHLFDTGFVERRNACDRLFHQWLEMIPVIVQQGEIKALGYALLGPGDRVRLIAAHDQSTNLFLEIGQPIGIAQGRQIARHRGDFFGHQVLVLHRYQRNIDPGHLSQLTRPLSATDHQFFALDTAIVGLHRTQGITIKFKARDLGILTDLYTTLARAAGQRLRDVRRVRLTVRRQKCGADQIIDIHHRPQVERFLRGK